MTISIKKLRAGDAEFDQSLSKALAWESVSNDAVQTVVADILENVKANGDSAVLEYTKKFDQLDVSSVNELEIPQSRLEESLANLPADQSEALHVAAKRIEQYHEQQKQGGWTFTESDGSVYGQKVSPIERVGMYVPGGKAVYPSTVLMDAIPARVAGVKEIIVTLPTPKGEVNELVLAALALAKVERVFTVGGAQAVAALAYGTETIPRVDKIVGPGNIFVATAKKAVFGQVGIDMVAGPSEILVLSDGSGNPDWVAMDLFSQAEHDEDAQSILVCPDKEFIHAVEQSIEKLLPAMERKDIISASLEKRGLLIEVSDLHEAVQVSNRIAPEHLELAMDNPESILDSIEHAGAIFMGHYSSESLGDYCAGPSHVLPTSGTARFSSALGVYDFQKRSSIIQCSPAGARELSKTASVLARCEGLTAHAMSAEFRQKELEKEG